MNEIDMKQKIKEVREKFLSNNQIEDIRQNISNVVEERLINLNNAQMLSFEELKRSHESINETVKNKIKDIEEVKKENEVNINQKVSILEEKVMQN